MRYYILSQKANIADFRDRTPFNKGFILSTIEDPDMQELVALHLTESKIILSEEHAKSLCEILKEYFRQD